MTQCRPPVVICSTSFACVQVTDRIVAFFSRLESTMMSSSDTRGRSCSLRLIFVIFKQPEVDDDVTVDMIRNFQRKNHNDVTQIKFKVIEGKFNRALGLDAGVKMVKLKFECENYLLKFIWKTANFEKLKGLN